MISGQYRVREMAFDRDYFKIRLTDYKIKPTYDPNNNVKNLIKSAHEFGLR